MRTTSRRPCWAQRLPTGHFYLCVRLLRPQTAPALPHGRGARKLRCNQPQPGPELIRDTERGRAAPKVPCSEVSTPVVSIRAMPTSYARPARCALARPARLCHFGMHQQTMPGLSQAAQAFEITCSQVTQLHRPGLNRGAAFQAPMRRPAAAAHRDARAAVARQQDVGALQVPVHDLRAINIPCHLLEALAERLLHMRLRRSMHIILRSGQQARARPSQTPQLTVPETGALSAAHTQACEAPAGQRHPSSRRATHTRTPAASCPSARISLRRQAAHCLPAQCQARHALRPCRKASPRATSSAMRRARPMRDTRPPVPATRGAQVMRRPPLVLASFFSARARSVSISAVTSMTTSPCAVQVRVRIEMSLLHDAHVSVACQPAWRRHRSACHSTRTCTAAVAAAQRPRPDFSPRLRTARTLAGWRQLRAVRGKAQLARAVAAWADNATAVRPLRRRCTRPPGADAPT